MEALALPSLAGRIVFTYMAFVIHLIVCEFHPIKADDLPHPGLSGAGGVWVDIESGSDAWMVSIPSYHPLRAVIHVSEKVRDIGIKLSQPKPTEWRLADEF